MGRESKSEFIIKVENNLHQIACLQSAELAETWTEMEKIPVASAAQNAPKEGEEAKPVEQKYETKERTRTTHTGIKFDTSSHAIPPQAKEALREQELAFYKKDCEFLDWKRIRNELEGYAYEMKAKLDEYGNLRAYMDPVKRDELLAKIAVCVEWIYDAGETAPYAEYETQLRDYQTRLQSPNVSHLTDEQINSIHNKIKFQGEYLQKVQSDLDAKNKWDEPGC